MAVETIANTQATSLLSYSAAEGGCVVRSTEAPHRLNQGVKACVELVLEDGRKLVCTPDHRVRTIRGDVEVQLLNATDRLLVAPEGPMVESVDEEWTLSLPLEECGEKRHVVLNYTSVPVDRQRANALARLMGFTSSQQSVSVSHDGATLYMQHSLDAVSIAHDIMCVLDTTTEPKMKRPSAASKTCNVLLSEQLVPSAWCDGRAGRQEAWRRRRFAVARHCDGHTAQLPT